jgi:hypothetical protein
MFPGDSRQITGGEFSDTRDADVVQANATRSREVGPNSSQRCPRSPSLKFLGLHQAVPLNSVLVVTGTQSHPVLHFLDDRSIRTHV